MTNEITTEQIQELMDFLTGNRLPPDWEINESPKLSPDTAFSVIYFLQERLYLIPDKFEKCEICDSIFDSQAEGYIISDEYDEDFYPDIGVSEDDHRQNVDRHFCRHECEVAFWDHWKADKEKGLER